MGEIKWRGSSALIARTTPAEAATKLTQIVASGSERHVVLQFSSPVDDAVRGQLRAAGVELLAPLGDGAFFAVARNAGKLSRAGSVPTLRAAAAIDRSMKLHSRVTSNDWPAYAIVGKAASESEDRVAIYAVFHGDVAMKRAVATAVRAGATVKSELGPINALVLELPKSSVAALADDDGVQWIEPPIPAMSSTNDSNRALTQAATVQTAPYNLTGAGVNVLVYDGGTARSTHQDFGGRVTVRDGSGMIDHATHVCGTIGGSGAASGGTFRGMAPGVTIQSYGLQTNGSGVFLYTNPGDLMSDYSEAINSFGAQIANNSIGTNTETNGFDCGIQGDYGVTDQLIDSIVRGSLGAPFRILWANGNERQGNRCDVEGFGDFYSTAPPACAKNHITVGAVNSNDDSMTSFSSWGPADDGRLKPDISGPGCQSNGDFGVTSCLASSDTAYGAACGTSMATPTVTGLCALLLEDFRTHFVGSADPRNSTLKILLAQNAVDRGNVGPDFQFGYGSVRIKDTIDFMRSGNFFENSVSQSGIVTTSVTVAPGTPQLKITLAWDDAPGTPNVNPALVNDLDLIVISPSSVRAFPWTLDPANPSAAAVRTQADHINNIEQVVVDSPAAGVWQVQVVGTTVPQGPQPFSLCGSPNIALPAGLSIVLPNGTPEVIAPNTPTVINVQLVTVNESIVPGSANLLYRFGPGGFSSTALVPQGGNHYTATLPGTSCSGSPEYYFSVQGGIVGTVTNPTAAPATTFSSLVGAITVLFDDDMEQDRGWTVGDVGDNATTGIWTRVDPVGTDAQPEDDHTAPPGTMCWVTGQGVVGGGLGDNDVDSGKTTLVSPTLNLSGGDAAISYYRWYSNNTGGAPNEDTFRVDISNANGAAGTWVNVETVGPAGAGTSGGWIFHEFSVGTFVTPTAQVKLRFVAEDASTGSLIEAALDDFHIERFSCVVVPSCALPGDMNGDGLVNGRDVQGFVSAELVSPFYQACADMVAPIGTLNAADVAAFVDKLVGH